MRATCELQLGVDDGRQAANLEQHQSPCGDWSATAVLVSALRSASRVQNTNTNCPHNTGLINTGGKKRRPGGAGVGLG